MRIIARVTGILLCTLALSACGGGYTSLFDGKTLEGWNCDPPEQIIDWKAVEGELVGENTGEKASIIWTESSFTDFEVELDYMTMVDDYDTGIFLRGMSQQVQIGISRSLQQDMTACIYAPEDDLGIYPGRTDKVAEIHKVGEWNHLKVILEGKRIRTFLNGEPMVDYTAVVIPDEGPLGLQLHGGVHMKVKFRDIRVKELGS
jgi:hypothetical protein